MLDKQLVTSATFGYLAQNSLQSRYLSRLSVTLLVGEKFSDVTKQSAAGKAIHQPVTFPLKKQNASNFAKVNVSIVHRYMQI